MSLSLEMLPWILEMFQGGPESIILKYLKGKAQITSTSFSRPIENH